MTTVPKDTSTQAAGMQNHDARLQRTGSAPERQQGSAFGIGKLKKTNKQRAKAASKQTNRGLTSRAELPHQGRS